MMCAYNENSLMLTRVYPFATRENHIHSRNALHCVMNKQPGKMTCENRLERLKRAKKYLPPVLQY